MRSIRLKTHLPLSEVRQLLHTGKDPIARTRLHAILLATQGKNRMEIAQTLGYSTRWVSQVVRRWNEAGVEAVKDGRHKNPGQKPKLTPEEQEKVLAALQAPPSMEVYGLAPSCGTGWSGSWGRGSPRSPIYWLLREMGFSLQLPRPQHRKADKEMQEEFKKSFFRRFRGSAGTVRG